MKLLPFGFTFVLLCADTLAAAVQSRAANKEPELWRK
jgi:hypothetical protein